MARGGKREGAGRKPGRVSQAKREIMEMAKDHAEAALKTLADISASGESEAARVSAANAILDRAYGKPVQGVTVDGSVRHEVSDDLKSALDAIARKITGGDGAGKVAGDGEADTDNAAG